MNEYFIPTLKAEQHLDSLAIDSHPEWKEEEQEEEEETFGPLWEAICT